MLKQLQIQNYAIIEDLAIDFSDRLNIITGETGAGKSILTGALGLILGQRADTSVLLSQDKKCFVEGIFMVSGHLNLAKLLEEEDLDPSDELVIRREIAASGKSRAFVNDTPVNLEQLFRVGQLLVDLHQQFDNLELAESDFQRTVVDVLAANRNVLDTYQKNYQEWASARKRWKAMTEEQARIEKDQDYHRFLKNELDGAGLRENELEDLDKELSLLSHAEGIKSLLSKMYFGLEDGEESIVMQLRTLSHQLSTFEKYHPGFPDILRRLQSAQLELKDISEELETINERIQYDPRRMEEINDRLALGHKLLKKHGLHQTSELIELSATLDRKLQAGLDLAADIAALQKLTDILHVQMMDNASRLSERRKAAVPQLEKKVKTLLDKVGMPNARLRVRISPMDPDMYGADLIEFLFDANKSERFEPLRKVASGGELSRLMLCIKSLIAQYVDLPTLIFDEIDTGISGEAAKQVGVILKELSGNRQVICITHQPQIAGKADAHFFVYKHVTGGSIRTQVRQLGLEERITVIAQMLGGEKPTHAALQNAREIVTQ